jgi:hypothetical protein
MKCRVIWELFVVNRLLQNIEQWLGLRAVLSFTVISLGSWSQYNDCGLDDRGLIPGRGRYFSFGLRVRVGRGIHLASCRIFWGGGAFPRAGAVRWLHLRLVSRSGMSGAVFTLPPIVFMVWRRSPSRRSPLRPEPLSIVTMTPAAIRRHRPFLTEALPNHPKHPYVPKEYLVLLLTVSTARVGVGGGVIRPQRVALTED